MGRGSNAAAELLLGRSAVRSQESLERPQKEFRLLSESEILSSFDKLESVVDHPTKGVLNGMKILARTVELSASTNKGTKRYRGFVTARKNPTTKAPEFVGIVLHGPDNAPERQNKEYYTGQSLATACAKVNAMISKKMAGKSSSSVYSPVTNSGPTTLNAQDIITQASEKILGVKAP